MWGPAGVGKTAIAQSCAKEATTRGVLGATFFFSRDNGVVAPAYFFTTIAYQLALQLDDYKAILGVKIQRNPAVLTKGLDAQFQELIISPFLELEGRNLCVQPRTVFIDGLDECGDDSAQAEMVELVASSIAEYGGRIPLLWAFFSRPEPHIEQTFSKYSASPFFWLIKLPISHSDDPDIRLFFRASLKLPDESSYDPSSRTGPWPSEEDLSTLVQMVAGLFIYAAVIVKYIMDPSALSPQRQLRDVLSLYLDQMLVTQVSEQDSPLAGLDAFYRMIMNRVPEKFLSIVQQILLVQTKWKLPTYTHIARDHVSPPVRLLANLFGLSIQEFENCFSKLRSVLTFEEHMLSPNGREKDGWPGSLMIVFYHASFLEFLHDPRRSGKYWIQDQRHWSSLAIKGLHLLKDIYAMNGLPQDKKIRKLRKLLPVCFSETAIPDEHFQFRDELCFDFLYTYTPVWCEFSGYVDEIIEELHRTDYAMLARLGESSGYDEPTSWQRFPENVRLADPHWKISHRRPPGERLFGHNRGWLNSPTDIESGLDYITSAFKILTEEAGCIDGLDQPSNVNQSPLQGPNDLVRSKVTDYFTSYVQDALEVAREINFEDLDAFDLLEYYCHEWQQYHYHYHANLGGARVPETIRRAALLPWEKNFLSVLQGTDNWLTNAALVRLKQLRDRDLLSQNASDVLLKFFESTIELQSTHGPSSSSYYATHIKSAVCQATVEYYTTEQSCMFLSDSTPLSNFKHIATRLSKEEYLHPGQFQSDMMQLCTDTLLKGHGEEVCKEFTVHLTAGNDKDLSWVLRATAWSVATTNQLLDIFKLDTKKMAFDTFLSADGDRVLSLQDSGTFERNLVDILWHNLELVEMTLETDGAKYHVPDDYAHKFRDGAEEVLEQIFNEYPQWRGEGNLWSHCARKAKEIRRLGWEVGSRCLYESDYETDLEECSWKELMLELQCEDHFQELF
ncbi:hypothetical protein D9756_008608 [Leucocoprinus leucothites]|uniref:NACHT domain-containing protein n=1 Tax=Leucocoprinus leucothites TaxID=201217 RepID=A0A8H5CYX6_9AGAR|nr:hypothetical protein D9756_008608 [Leucoagaricus leucothites]